MGRREAIQIKSKSLFNLGHFEMALRGFHKGLVMVRMIVEFPINFFAFQASTSQKEQFEDARN